MLLYMVKVRSQDAICGLGASGEGRDVAWTWLKVNNTKPVVICSFTHIKLKCIA